MFAQNGYARASTNEIARRAGIAKGSLFNYFRSKRELYLFLLEHVSEIIGEIYRELDYQEPDFFQRVRDLGRAKFRVMRKYPQAFDFLKAAGQEEDAEVSADIRRLRDEAIQDAYGKIYAGIDWGKFREDLDLERVVDIINWTMLGFSERQVGKLDSFEDLDASPLAEWEAYADIMKRAFYREGGE